MAPRRSKRDPLRSAVLTVRGGVARIVAEYDATGVRSERRDFPVAEHAFLRRVVEERKTVVCDVRDDSIEPGTRARLDALGLHWSALTPIESDDVVVGVLRISSRDPVRFTEQRRATLEAIANVAGMAIGR